MRGGPLSVHCRVLCGAHAFNLAFSMSENFLCFCLSFSVPVSLPLSLSLSVSLCLDLSLFVLVSVSISLPPSPSLSSRWECMSLREWVCVVPANTSPLLLILAVIGVARCLECLGSTCSNLVLTAQTIIWLRPQRWEKAGLLSSLFPLEDFYFQLLREEQPPVHHAKHTLTHTHPVPSVYTVVCVPWVYAMLYVGWALDSGGSNGFLESVKAAKPAE